MPGFDLLKCFIKY